MKYSEYYNMNLPENSDYALIEPLNENTQAIDAELKNRENALIAHDASVESHPDILAQIRNINDGMDNVYTKPETDDLVSGAVSTHNAAPVHPVPAGQPRRTYQNAGGLPVQRHYRQPAYDHVYHARRTDRHRRVERSTGKIGVLIWLRH